jgi:hypothetical protein
MQFTFAGPTFLNTEVFLSNFGASLGVISRSVEVAADPGVAAATVGQTQTLPVGAIVQRAVYTVRARPAGLVTIGTIAQVRPGTGGDFVVDFQGMRTVERVHAPVAITEIRPWAGTQFADDSVGAKGASTDKQFTEVLTERLLVHFAGSLGADDLAANGSVAVLSPPADLELLVNGTRAWFNAGPAKPGGDPADPAAFVVDVDRRPLPSAVATARRRRERDLVVLRRACRGSSRRRCARLPEDVRGGVPGGRHAAIDAPGEGAC